MAASWRRAGHAEQSRAGAHGASMLRWAEPGLCQAKQHCSPVARLHAASVDQRACLRCRVGLELEQTKPDKGTSGADRGHALERV